MSRKQLFIFHLNSSKKYLLKCIVKSFTSYLVHFIRILLSEMFFQSLFQGSQKSCNLI